MTDRELARRTDVEIYFAGVNISASVRDYLLALTYTDNEEGEADDLQIELQDRDGLWLTKWLNDAVQAAAGGGGGTSSAGNTYQVTAQSGLNVRSGPGTDYEKIGALAYGARVDVVKIEDGWAEIKYSGEEAYVSAAYLTHGTAPTAASPTTKGLKIQASIVQKNWNGDGKDRVLECGQFELDCIEAGGPGATVTIKGTALPFRAQIRQTRKSKAWEYYTLRQIAQEIATTNGLACIYESAHNPYYERVEQANMSDISFLSRLCRNAGISLKSTNNIIVLFDQASYERQPAIMTIKRGSGQYTKYRLRTGEADQQYDACRVSYVDPATGRVIRGMAYIDGYDPNDKNNQLLNITAKVATVAEAEALAQKMLRLKNKYEYTAQFTMIGNTALVAGMTVNLADFGAWDGKYLVTQATHSVGRSGYTTQIRLRRVLEGY